MMSTAWFLQSTSNGSFRKMSSPVRMGMSTASEIFFNSSVSCQGIMSSSHERLYLVSALPSRMQLLTLKGPK